VSPMSFATRATSSATSCALAGPQAAGPVARLAREPGLADAGLSCDKHHATLAARSSE